MARPNDFLGYWFRHANGTPAGDTWEVTGTVYWTLNPDRVSTPQALQDFLAEWDNAGYKIGFQIGAGQEIQEVVYGGVALRPVPDQDRAAQQLEATYGAFAGFKWVALGSKGRREQRKVINPNIVTFPVRMRISLGGDGPALIPVAARHLEGSFAESFASVWALGRRGRTP